MKRTPMTVLNSLILVYAAGNFCRCIPKITESIRFDDFWRSMTSADDGGLSMYSRDNASRISIGTAPAVIRRTGASTSRTGTSRLRSSRTATGQRTRTQNTRSDDAFVVALIENASKEVGFCVYNLQGFDVELRQFADSNSFSTTISTLCIFE